MEGDHRWSRRIEASANIDAWLKRSHGACLHSTQFQQAHDGQRKKQALLLEDPGATDNFITHELAKQMKLPSRSTSLMGGGVQPESKGFEVVFLLPILTLFWTLNGERGGGG